MLQTRRPFIFVKISWGVKWPQGQEGGNAPLLLTQSIALKFSAAPSFIPLGQRAVTVLVRV